MSSVPLGEIVEIKGGGTPDKAVADYWNGDIPWASVKDFKSTSLDRTTDFITQAGVKNSATNIIPAGTIIVPTRMAVGKAAISTIDLAINQDLKALFPKKAADTRYLLHALLASSDHLERHATGATVKGITLDVLRGIKIPFPPLPEQRRIAGILDQADALRRLRSQSLARLSELGQAIFIERFGRTDDMPMLKIGDFALVKGGKRLPKGADYAMQPTNHPYVRVSNLTDGYIDPNGMKFITEEVHRAIARYVVRTDDVVISIAGTIGVVAPVRGNLDGANLTENAAKITAKPGFLFDPDYLTWALQTPELRQAIRANTGQVTIGKLALFRIENLAMPFPDIKLQRGFAEQMKGVTEKRQLLQNAAETADSLFASLQHRAFRGKL